MATTTLTPPEVTSTPEHKLELLRSAFVQFSEKRNELETVAVDLEMRAGIIGDSINTAEERELATGFMQEVARGNKDVEALIEKPKTIAHSIWKGFTGVEGDLKSRFQLTRTRLEPLALKFDAEREKERKAEDARLAAIAQKRAEDEALEEAIRLQAEGHTEAAEQVLSAPIIPEPTLATQYAPVKTKGEAKSGTWEVTVEDIKALAKAVVDGIAPPTCIVADLSILKKRAAADQKDYNIPGTTAHFKPGLRVRA